MTSQHLMPLATACYSVQRLSLQVQQSSINLRLAQMECEIALAEQELATLRYRKAQAVSIARDCRLINLSLLHP